MSMHHETTAYTDSLKAFVGATDEKEKIFERLARLISREGYQRVLDIGAGNGDLAVPLSGVAKHYLAIERNDVHAAHLRSRGLPVLYGVFPKVLPDDQFDLVLSSHSLPRGEDEIVAFVRAAWALVRHGGSLCIVTYDETRESEWGSFLGLIRRPEAVSSPRHAAATEDALLRTCGNFRKEPIPTAVSTDTVDEMLSALAFVYSDGREEECTEFQSDPKVRAVLTRVYPQRGKYVFPFEHTLYVVRRG